VRTASRAKLLKIHGAMYPANSNKNNDCMVFGQRRSRSAKNETEIGCPTSNWDRQTVAIFSMANHRFALDKPAGCSILN
jgi:hypothetical protein